MIQNLLEHFMELADQTLPQAVKELAQLPVHHGAWAFDYLIQHYPKTDVLSECAEAYSLRQHADFAKRVRDAECLRVTAQKGSTIGICSKAGSGDSLHSRLLMTDRLISAGYRVIVYCDQIPEEVSETDLSNSGILWQLLPDDSNPKGRLAKLEAGMKEHRFHTMFLFDYSDASLLWDLLLCRLFQVPVLIHRCESFSGLTDSYSYQLPQLPSMLQLAHALIVPTDADRLYASFFIPNSYVMPSLLSGNIRDVVQTPLHSQTILWIDAFTAYSQPAQMITAFSLVHQKVPAAVLFMVTDFTRYQEEHRNHFNELIQQYGLKRHLILCEAQEDLSVYFHASSLLVANSYAQEATMTLLEAQSYGLPVVTYDFEPHTLADENDGLVLVPWNRYDLLAASVIELLADDILRLTKGTASCRYVRQLMDYDYAGMLQTVMERIGCPLPDMVDETHHLMWETFYSDYSLALSRLDDGIAVLENELTVQGR